MGEPAHLTDVEEGEEEGEEDAMTVCQGCLEKTRDLEEQREETEQLRTRVRWRTRDLLSIIVGLLTILAMIVLAGTTVVLITDRANQPPAHSVEGQSEALAEMHKHLQALSGLLASYDGVIQAWQAQLEQTGSFGAAANATTVPHFNQTT